MTAENHERQENVTGASGMVEDLPSVPVARRFPALRVLSMLYAVFACLAAVGGSVGVVVGIVLAMIARKPAEGAIISLFSLLYGGLAFVVFLGLSQAMRALLEVEENMRLALAFLGELVRREK